MYYRKRKIPKFNTDELVKKFMDGGGEVTAVAPAFGVDKQFDKNLAKFYQSAEWREARAYVLAHTKNECAYCGSEEKLQVDHIRPLRHYWDIRSSPDNLQILCEDCNYAKGSNSDYDYHLYQIRHRAWMIEDADRRKKDEEQ